MSYFVTAGTDTEAHFLSHEHLNVLYPSLSCEKIREIIDEATQETMEASIELFINSRKDLAMKIVPLGQLNVGEISRISRETYNADNVRYRHGKTVLKRVKSKLQQELKENIKPFVPSPFLTVDELKIVADSIWPVAHPEG